MQVPHLDNPGPWHEVIEVNGAFHISPTKAFASRFDMGAAALLFAAVLVLPVAWYHFVTFAFLETLLAVGCVFYYLFPARKPEPLVVTPDGRIEFCGRELRPKGRVKAVRVFRREHGADDVDTYHVEVLSEGSVLELPKPDFGNAEALNEILVLAAWLAQVFTAPMDEQIGEGPTVPHR